MDLQSAILGAGIAGVIGIFGYVIKKYVGSKMDKAIKAQISLIKKRHLEKYDAIKDISGMIAQIDHYVKHIVEGDYEYIEKSRGYCMIVREVSRKNIILLGQKYVDFVKQATDHVLDFCKKQNKESLSAWEKLSPEIHLDGQNLLKDL